MADILPGIQYVIQNSEFVSIDKDSIAHFCNAFNHEHITHWVNKAPFDLSKLDEDEKLNFLLTFNTISFSYWGKPKWKITYKNEEYDGSWAMIACLGRALESNKSMLRPEHLAGISKEEFAAILAGNVEIPLLEERWKMVREVNSILNERFDGEFKNLISLADGNSQKLLDLIINNFPSFEDAWPYKDRQIYFYKRAQLLVSDVYQLFKGKGVGKLKNIDKLTACADYKIPQMLRKLGIIKYSKDLANKIDAKIQLVAGSKEEVEIRAATIWATEVIKEALKRKNPNVDSIHINDHLWLLSQNKNPDDKPYHRIRTTSY